MNDVEKMHNRPCKTATEVEAFSRLHRAHRWNHGRRGLVKVSYTRRERRGSRQGLRAYAF